MYNKINDAETGDYHFLRLQAFSQSKAVHST
jgi:hypothetical protein